MSTHLVIPDPHARPGHDLERFEWIGRMIVDLRPDVVICLGDMADMASLYRTKYPNKEKYQEDIIATQHAMARLLKPLRMENIKRKAWKKKMWKPRFVMTLGNHENRIAGKQGCKFEHLPYDAWEVYPYREPVQIDGVTYVHSAISGVMARDIGGDNPATKILNTTHTSTTVGHGHVLDFAVQTDINGNKLYGLVAGCYDDSDHDYAGPANKLWWRGCVVKRNVKDGSYDPEFINLSTIKERYGDAD